jgi:hypothetical protein
MDFTVDFTVKVVFVLGDLRVDVLEENEIRVKTFRKVNSRLGGLLCSDGVNARVKSPLCRSVVGVPHA